MTTVQPSGKTEQSGKADFGDIYNRPDASAYYRTLQSLDYTIPQFGAEVARQLIAARVSAGRREPQTVLDVCCSYGVGGVLLTTELSLDDLYAHYRDAAEQNLGREQILRADRELLARHRRADAPRVIGLDVAGNAVSYALEAGALDHGVVADLEKAEPEPQLAEMLAEVDLILCTGGVGYVTERTFGRLLGLIGGSPWVVGFCLRAYDYAPIERVLAERGLHTERSSQTFPQRRFVDADEQRWAIAELTSRGLDPAGKEADGHHHAELFLSRPPEDARQLPLGELVPDRSAGGE
jgi:hypothetical protein